MTSDRRAGSAAAVLILAVSSAAMWFASPTAGDFWWSDAPRHALNGAFVRDFIVAHPWRHPADWAVRYYLQYPALTILYYPPLFYVVEALLFLVFGVSHAVAQGTVALFVFVLAMATYTLACRVLPRWSAVGAALLLIGAPEVSLWARQVMLDVPALAAVAVAACWFVRYRETERPAYLAWTAVSLAIAASIKQTAVFLALAVVATSILDHGWRWLRQRHVWWSGFLLAAGLVPVAIMTVKFGTANIENVVGRPGDLAPTSLAAWLFYLKVLPRSLGPVTLTLAAAGGFALTSRPAPHSAMGMVRFLIVWCAVAYVFFSAIGNREARYGLMLLLPMAIVAGAGLQAVLPNRMAQIATVALGLGTFSFSLSAMPVPTVDGYGLAAAYVASVAPPEAVVMFHGARDGNFIFAIRANSSRRDIAVVRTDKLLVRVLAGERIRGVTQADLSEADIAALIRDLGVGLIAFQPGFWGDLREMERFAAVLRTPAFERMARFDITGATSVDEHAVEIYRPTYPVARPRRAITLDMPMIGGQFAGDLAPR